MAGRMEPLAYLEQVEAPGTELVQLLLDQAMPLAGELLDWTQPPVFVCGLLICLQDNTPP